MASKSEWVFAIIVFFIIFAAVFLLLLPKPQQESFKFKAVEQGITFYSNESEPKEFLKKFSDKNDFYIVISLTETGSNSSFMGNSMVMLESVLKASGKNATALIKQFEGSNLAFCQTNYASAQINEKISSSECLKILNSKENFIIIEDTDSSLESAQVILEKNKATIKPKIASDAQSAAFMLLKTMFADSEEKIKLLNDFLKKSG